MVIKLNNKIIPAGNRLRGPALSSTQNHRNESPAGNGAQPRPMTAPRATDRKSGVGPGPAGIPSTSADPALSLDIRRSGSGPLEKAARSRTGRHPPPGLGPAVLQAGEGGSAMGAGVVFCEDGRHGGRGQRRAAGRPSCDSESVLVQGRRPSNGPLSRPETATFREGGKP